MLFHKNTKKKLFFSSLIVGISFFILSSKCNNKETNTITIGYNYDNGWTEESKNAFSNLLAKKYKEIIKNNSQFKNLNSNIIFKFKKINDKNQILTDLITNKKNNLDLGILSYGLFANKIKEKKDLEKFEPQFIAQTKTYKFIWDTINNPHYYNGLKNDKLRKLAELQNNEYFDKYGEFKNWYSNINLNWDGSKYKNFYNENETTEFYRGNILISGNEAIINQITKAWEQKDWETFKSFGIIHDKNTSGSKFKFQLNLLSKHFNISYQKLIEFFNSQDNKQHILGKAKKILGKENYYIAFSEEGIFNWTKSKKDSNDFNPNNQQHKIRVLTTTENAPYDALLARSKMSKELISSLKKLFNSIETKENDFGIYTGYNQFLSGDNELFWKYINMQNKIENN